MLSGKGSFGAVTFYGQSYKEKKKSISPIKKLGKQEKKKMIINKIKKTKGLSPYRWAYLINYFNSGWKCFYQKDNFAAFIEI